MTTPLTTYSLEMLCVIFVHKRYGDRRKSNVYHGFHIAAMILNFILTTILVGFIRTKFQGSWVGSFMVAMLFDIMILDFLILLFAILKNNDSKILNIFRKRGFYVNTGDKAIITQEDIDELLRKARGADAAEGDPDAQTEVDLENAGNTGGNDGTDGANGADGNRKSNRNNGRGSVGRNKGGAGRDGSAGGAGGRMRPIRGRGRIPLRMRDPGAGGIDFNNGSSDDDDEDYDREYYIGSLKKKEFTGERPPWKP